MSNNSKWDAPVDNAPKGGPSSWDHLEEQTRRRKWDATPIHTDGVDETPKRTKWDATPMAHAVSEFAEEFSKPLVSFPTSSPSLLISSDLLNSILPRDGFHIVDVSKDEASASYSGFFINLEQPDSTGIFGSTELPLYKPEDYQFFGRLLEHGKITADIPIEEAKELKVLQLLLRIKNGDPSMRRYSSRMLIEKAKEFGSELLLGKILALLMTPSLDDHERHLIVRVLDQVLVVLGEQIKPFVPRILNTLQPLLVNESYFVRSEGKEMIANVIKASGLPCIIAALRPDIDNSDENIRNNTCRIFGIVASTLGMKPLLPFIRAAVGSKKSPLAKQSAMKMIQQIAISLGSSILQNLSELTGFVASGLIDDQHKTRLMAILALSALAESSYPYGLDHFLGCIPQVFSGIKQNRGKALAAYIKACGNLLVLMEQAQATAAFKDLLPFIIKEFRNSDDEMRRIVLKFLYQAFAHVAVSSEFVRDRFFRDFVEFFWTDRIAQDRKMASDCIAVFLSICKKVGVNDAIYDLLPFLKDTSENVRRLTTSCLSSMFAAIGTSPVDPKLEARIFDGLLFAYQEMQTEDAVSLKSIGDIFTLFNQRSKAYLPSLANVILWHLSNRSAKIRSNAANLIHFITPVVALCEESILVRLCVVLYENLGEEYPDVLASIVRALKTILIHIGISRCNPPIGEILLRVSPILRNRHEKVQESTVELVGMIAEKAPDSVSAREWMRISFELLELLRSPRKIVRRISVLTFGHIAKAIGPHDILTALLNNLKVQERQNRVCTTVAIAIVADACSPFTVIPALMNEYRVPELNVQNGVLKAIAFLFEYIGELAKDYIFAITPLLEDALMERDLVHRQIAATATKHAALGVSGFGCEEAMIHLLNLIWSNIFETSPHVINCVVDAIDAITTCVGPATTMQYSMQGLFHPARRVREIYWRTFNNCYVGASDALVAFYPRLYNSASRKFERTFLDYSL